MASRLESVGQLLERHGEGVQYEYAWLRRVNNRGERGRMGNGRRKEMVSAKKEQVSEPAQSGGTRFVHTGQYSAKVGFGLILVSFLAFLVHNVYEDHQMFVQENGTLRTRLEMLEHKSEPSKILRNNPEFGSFVNGTMAFMFLSDPNWQIDAQKRCHVKITSPKENAEVAAVLFSMAVSVGCQVEPSQNPIVDVNAETEIMKGAVPDCILVHLNKGDDRRDGFVVGLSNLFTVKQSHDMPDHGSGSVIWLQIGSGDPWRKI